MAPLYEREAATPQSLTETSKIHSQVTHKVQTRAVGRAEERFVQTVRLASCDLNMKTGVGKTGPLIAIGRKVMV